MKSSKNLSPGSILFLIVAALVIVGLLVILPRMLA